MSSYSDSPYSADPTAAMAGRPSILNTAFWLYLASIVVGLISTFVGIPQITAAAHAAATQSTTKGVSADTLATIGVTTALVGGILGAIVWGIFLVFLRRDHGWARWVLGVFALLSLVGITSTYGLGALHAILAVIAAVLTFLRPSTAWFQQTAATRRAAKAGRV